MSADRSDRSNQPRAFPRTSGGSPPRVPGRNADLSTRGRSAGCARSAWSEADRSDQPDREAPWARNLDPVVEHLARNVVAGDAIRPVHHRVNKAFKPSILRNQRHVTEPAGL